MNGLFLKTTYPVFSVLRIFGLVTLLMFAACDDTTNDIDPVPEEEEEENDDSGLYRNGVFVLSEGAWKAGNSSVSFIDHETDEVSGKLFKEANGADLVLGDLLMDMVSVDTLSFFVLNFTSSVVVVNNKTFEFVAEIEEGINSPRYAVVFDDKVFVTQWGNNGEVVTIDPATLSVTASVGVGAGPDGIAVIDDHLWVANSGGYGSDNTISVVDPESNTVTNTIEVADCPKSVVTDINGDVWTICAGFVSDYETGETTMPGLVRINRTSKQVEETFNLPASTYGNPSLIAASRDGNSVCFANTYGLSGVWKMGIDANEVPDAPWLDELPYSMGVDPVTGEIYLGISPDFINPGYVTVYDTDGKKTATYEENIGIGPCNFVFVSE